MKTSASLPQHTLRVYSDGYCRERTSSSVVYRPEPKARKVFATKSKTKTHLHFPNDLEPCLEETAFWGTPIYFSNTSAHRDNILREHDQRKNGSPSANNRQSHTNEPAVVIERNQRHQERDYELYLQYATKYGGLEGTLYATRYCEMAPPLLVRLLQ